MAMLFFFSMTKKKFNLSVLLKGKCLALNLGVFFQSKTTVSPQGLFAAL